MQTKIVTINAELAVSYLSKNMVNRTLSPNRVNQYADSLRRGDWQLNGESIKFNEKGEMIDGQHRLSAIIKSGVPMTTLVIFDVPDDVSVLDRGRNRNLTDSLIIEGMPKSVANNTTVAMAKLFYTIQSSGRNPSDSFVREWLEKNQEDIEEIYAIGSKSGSGKTKSYRLLVKNAPMLLAMYFANKVEVPITELVKFSEVIATGFYDSRKETSAIVLRNDITNKAIDISRGGADRVRATYKIEKAIYDYHHGIERKQSYKNVDKPVYSNNAMFRI